MDISNDSVDMSIDTAAIAAAEDKGIEGEGDDDDVEMEAQEYAEEAKECEELKSVALQVGSSRLIFIHCFLWLTKFTNASSFDDGGRSGCYDTSKGRGGDRGGKR